MNEDGSLMIKHAEISDAGIYVCIAQNSAGTAMGQVRLIVQGITASCLRWFSSHGPCGINIYLVLCGHKHLRQNWS